MVVRSRWEEIAVEQEDVKVDLGGAESLGEGCGGAEMMETKQIRTEEEERKWRPGDLDMDEGLGCETNCAASCGRCWGPVHLSSTTCHRRPILFPMEKRDRIRDRPRIESGKDREGAKLIIAALRSSPLPPLR